MPLLSLQGGHARPAESPTGELEARERGREIVDRLRDQGLMPMQIAPAAGGAGAASRRAAPRAPRRRLFASKHVTRDQLIAITRELATLLRAGLPLDRALEILIGLAPTPPVAALLQGVRDDVRGGKALSQALDARREVFSRFYVNIVRAGEAGGALGVVLQRLADTMERNKELRENVSSALIYPTILIGVAVRLGDRAADLRRAAVPADVRAGGQGAAAADRDRRRSSARSCANWWWAALAVVVLFALWLRRRASNPAVRRALGRARCCACRSSATWSPRSRSRASRARWRRCSATA